MTQDTYYETSIKRNPTKGQIGVSYFLIAMIFISAFTIMRYFPFAGIPLAIVAAIAFYFIHYFYKRAIYLDFDYTMTNGELDIAKVMGGEKRKHLLTINCREGLIFMAPLNSPELKQYDQQKLKTYDCTSFQENVPVYCMIAKAAGDDGEKIRLYFEPDQEMMKEFHRLSPRNVKVL